MALRLVELDGLKFFGTAVSACNDLSGAKE